MIPSISILPATEAWSRLGHWKQKGEAVSWFRVLLLPSLPRAAWGGGRASSISLFPMGRRQADMKLVFQHGNTAGKQWSNRSEPGLGLTCRPFSPLQCVGCTTVCQKHVENITVFQFYSLWAKLPSRGKSQHIKSLTLSNLFTSFLSFSLL